MTADHGNFRSIADCDTSARDSHSVAADLDGTLLASNVSFPYFFLLAVESSGLLRGVALLLLSPLILAVYKLFSESAGIQIMIYVAVAGVPIRDIELIARGVLPRFYAADVRSETYRIFHACGGKRVVVTANPTVMVEPFVKDYLGGDRVLGTELEVNSRTGKATGFVAGAGVLVGDRKRDAVRKEFGDDLPEVGIGDRESDHAFMALCKEGYMVQPNRSAARVPPQDLQSRTVFHDGRLVQRPDCFAALLVLLWFPLGVFLAIFRIFFNLHVPANLVRHTYRLTGIRLSIRGRPPLPSTPGTLLVCNHRTALDPILVSIALGRPVTCVTYSVSRLSRLLSPISAVPLTRDRAIDANRISVLLRQGDVVICPEGTTCREPFLLRFSALFAELSDRIVPVAINTRQSLFFGTTVRGFKFADPYFFFMNPRPEYDITFLPALRTEYTCAGGKSAIEVATHVQRVIAAELGFECTALTRKDKYLRLGGFDGKDKKI